MRQAAKRGLLTALATGSVLASTAGYAFATADAQGSAAGSPGVGSGNTVQVPVDVPVNICGNTINIVGLLNPAMGNTCVNASSKGHDRHDGHVGGSHGARSAGADASGTSTGSPGVASGNTVQIPVHVPLNVCGNAITAIGLVNPAIGNHCANYESAKHKPTPSEHHHHHHHPAPTPSHHRPTTPPKHHHEHPQPQHQHHQKQHNNPKPGHNAPLHPVAPAGGSETVGHHAHEALASTGAGDMALAGSLAAGMIFGGAVLYRRGRYSSR